MIASLIRLTAIKYLLVEYLYNVLLYFCIYLAFIIHHTELNRPGRHHLQLIHFKIILFFFRECEAKQKNLIIPLNKKKSIY